MREEEEEAGGLNGVITGDSLGPIGELAAYSGTR